MPNRALSTLEIRAIFTEEITDAGGDVSDIFDDGERVFARSILPWVSDVRPGDQMKGGVALKADGCDVSIHPYLFRMVCRNGAIRAHAIQTRRLEISGFVSPEDATAALRDSVRACCVEEAFTEGIQEVGSAVETSINMALTIAPLLSRMSSVAGAKVFQEIVFRFVEGADRSRFAFMNAVTSIARDTRDPELRWRLEELGGGIPVGRTPSVPTAPAIETRFLESDAGLEGSHYEPAGELLVGDRAAGPFASI
jgi:hypothetical protein